MKLEDMELRELTNTELLKLAHRYNNSIKDEEEIKEKLLKIIEEMYIRS